MGQAPISAPIQRTFQEPRQRARTNRNLNFRFKYVVPYFRNQDGASSKGWWKISLRIRGGWITTRAYKDTVKESSVVSSGVWPLHSLYWLVVRLLVSRLAVLFLYIIYPVITGWYSLYAIHCGRLLANIVSTADKNNRHRKKLIKLMIYGLRIRCITHHILQSLILFCCTSGCQWVHK